MYNPRDCLLARLGVCTALYVLCLQHAHKHIVVVVDSNIQRIVLATEETTVTQQVSHRPIRCQSRLWSQRGTKVNGSHHGNNPLLRPTGIRIATKRYATLQAASCVECFRVAASILVSIYLLYVGALTGITIDLAPRPYANHFCLGLSAD